MLGGNTSLSYLCFCQVITDSDIRSACIQVLFSMVYHLKSAVLPYSSDILEASIRSLREESDKVGISKIHAMFSILGHEFLTQVCSLTSKIHPGIKIEFLFCSSGKDGWGQVTCIPNG